MDIYNIPAQVTQRVTVGIGDDGVEYGFVIVSRDSEQYREKNRKLRAGIYQRNAIKKNAIDAKTESGALQLVDLTDQNQLDEAAAVVVDWFGFSKAGKPAAFDESAARNALKLRSAWRDAITRALDNEAGFLPSSAQS